MYGNSGSLGDGSAYGLAAVTNPVKFAVLYSSQSAPYNSGITGNVVASIFSRGDVAAFTADVFDGSVDANFDSSDCTAPLWYRPKSALAVLPSFADCV